MAAPVGFGTVLGVGGTKAPALVVGPLLRYVDERRATLWVEVDRGARVEVRVGGASFTDSTWSVHGHHYAIVVIDGLAPATTAPYQVLLDGTPVWPPADGGFPPSVIRTLDPDGEVRLAFGSCRRSAPFDDEHHRRLGADALAALAGRMRDQPLSEWPNTLLMLGDQVYADEPSAAICEQLRARRDLESGPRTVKDEIRDFEEYTWLYREAWSEPAVRWLLSTVPVGMLLDDHDLRDDWNTSMSWRNEVTRQPWWRARVVGAYGSYWVYQHLGNLGPDDLAQDRVLGAMRSLSTDEERSAYLDDFAWRADVESHDVRFSFARDLGTAGRGVRLVAIDSRCSRQLDPDDRRMLDPVEWAWVRDAVLAHAGDDDHVVLASTLPMLMPPGVHHLEGGNEAIAQGAWGRWPARVGEWLRRLLDLEHWAAFRESFADLTDLLRDVVTGPSPPATVLLLGGDIHCSYTASAGLTALDHPATAIGQLTMSPFRNFIQRPAKVAIRLLNRPRWARAAHRFARRVKLDDVAVDWELTHGPWFDNGVMMVSFAGRSARLAVEQARVEGGRPVLHTALRCELAGETSSSDDVTASATE